MFTELSPPDLEPPQCFSEQINSTHPDNESAAEMMLAAVPPQAKTHALVIGRHTLEPVLALVKCGCDTVETHSLDAPLSHMDEASLAWISDINTSAELEAAVQQASSCLNSQGYMVVDATGLEQPTAVMTALRCLLKVGFRLRSVLHQGCHLILVAVPRAQAVLAA